MPIENENVSQEASLPKSITTCSVYAAIINHYFQPPTVEPRLLRYGFSNDCLKDVYNLPFVITIETKFQIFQYKIIHNILQPNDLFFVWSYVIPKPVTYVKCKRIHWLTFFTSVL